MNSRFFSCRAAIGMLLAVMSLSSMATQAQPGEHALVIDRPEHATDASLTLIGPGGFHVGVNFSTDEAVVPDARRIAELALPDGRYNFEVRFSRQPEGELTAAAAELRAAGEVGSAPARALAPVSDSLKINDGDLLGGDSFWQAFDQAISRHAGAAQG